MAVHLGLMPTDDSTLLSTRDTPAYELLDVEPSVPVLIVCDHASRRIPESLGDLGVPSQYLREHIAWDIGAGAVARALSAKLQLPAVLAGYSRLLVDCNRNLDDPSAFPEVSDGIRIPGNESLSQSERQQRANAFYWPYHHAIRDRIRILESLAPAPALIAVHSFTPALNGVSRPWHFGVMWDKDQRMATTLIENLTATAGIVVGDNQPYSGRHPADFTIDHHAEVEGLPHAGIEVRQDLVQSEAGVEEWSERLAQALAPILEDRSLYTNRAGGP